MWVRGAAIRPVPAYAVVPSHVLDDVEAELAASGYGDNPDLDDAFSRFERTQPHLAQLAATVLQKPLDETALALGYFLNIAVWLAFERAFGPRLEEVTEGELEAAQSAVALEEELRAAHAEEPLDVEDVMAIEQPAVLAFLNEHVDAALEPADREQRDVDVDDVHTVYRAALVLTLALSHGVRPVGAEKPRELLA
ncbi:MAG: hypothetical protein KC657_22840 [Myxococcales bacterium]|nr:hypothetical protein [Myxococcales bacterium]